MRLTLVFMRESVLQENYYHVHQSNIYYMKTTATNIGKSMEHCLFLNFNNFLVVFKVDFWSIYRYLI